MAIQKLNQFVDNVPSDAFVLFVSRDQYLTRDKKPYWRVTFRDETRELTFPIWENSPQAAACKTWVPGSFYKIRATLRTTQYGANLDIQRIRPVRDEDQSEGFNPQMGVTTTAFDPEEMFAEILQLLKQNISDPALLRLVEHIYTTHQAEILAASAAAGKHHAMAGGLLEHSRNVLTTALWLAERYTHLYPTMEPPLDKGLVAAGAALHDIGKLRELRASLTAPNGFEYTPEGNLLGHIVMGRDYVRDAVAELKQEDPDYQLDFEIQLRLEHAILSHQRLPEWGSPKTNMTPEALLIHYADDIDAKYCIMAQILAEAAKTTPDAECTDTKNALHQVIFRGMKKDKEE